MIQHQDERKPIGIFAAKNNNKGIREQSSSGGIFTLLAENIIAQNGVVFGVRFNEKWEAVHDYTEDKNGLELFRGSKYIESVVGDSFKKARAFLKEGRKVLFSGTPCQISGLNLFLRKKYPNLITVDFVCHGIPSPQIFQDYLAEVVDKNKLNGLNKILFRDKVIGWKKYSLTLIGSDKKVTNVFHNDLFMKGFLADLYLRPSCNNCPSKKFRSGSDITLADYWGVRSFISDFDDDRGVSLIFVNTDAGNDAYSRVDAISVPTSYKDAICYNPSVEKSVKMNPKRKRFFVNYNNGNKSIESLIQEYTRLSTTNLIINKLRRIKNKIKPS